MPTSIALDTSPSTLEPLQNRGRDRDRFSDARDDCPVCIRIRARSAPDQLSIQERTIYTGERLAAVNRALAAAAADHAASEPYGLGSPSLEDKDKEVARFRLLQRNIRTSSHSVETLPNPSSTASTPRSRVGSMTMSLSSASSSRPSSEHSGYSIDISKWKNVETLEFRARFTLVQGPHPGMWQYHVTDDWSNAEAWIPATPKFRRIANAVARLFTRRNSAGSAAGDEDSNQDDATKHSPGAGAADGDAFKTSRQLPGPTTRSRPVSWILR